MLLFYSFKDDGEMKLANHASQDISTTTTKTLIPFLLMSELGIRMMVSRCTYVTNGIGR